MKGPRRGFTLVELMMVIAIIGMLASLAVPSLQGFVLRAKLVEKKMMVRTIAKAGVHLYNKEGQWPGGAISLAFRYNPDVPVVPATPVPFDPRFDNWPLLDIVPDGPCRYRYAIQAVRVVAARCANFYIYADGDVDGDGSIDQGDYYQTNCGQTGGLGFKVITDNISDATK